MISLTFGKRLKSLRKKKELTQQELANLLLVSKSTICNYEKGNRMASIDTLIKICNIFNIDIDYLVGYKSANVTKKDVIVNILYEEYEMIEVLKKYNKLYELVLDNPQRIFSFFNNKLF